jgi:ammonium transporter Rh
MTDVEMAVSAAAGVPEPAGQAGPQPHGNDVQQFLSAANDGDVWKVSKMLNDGIPPDVADYDKRVALHLASAEGHAEIVRLLLSKGANVDTPDRWGNTPLSEAIRSGQRSVVQVLKEKGATLGSENRSMTELITAASNNDMDTISSLVQAGVDINKGDYDGRTALHLAVCEGHLDMVKFLLDHGANPNLQDRWGSTPLADAMRRSTRTGSDDMVDLLSSHGAIAHLEAAENVPRHFAALAIVLEVAFVILFGTCVEYSPLSAAPRSAQEALSSASMEADSSFSATYPFFQDVHVMIFIGFGFLMTFLRKYGYSSVGFTFVISAFVIQWHILVGGFMHNAFASHWEKIALDLNTLMVSDFAAGACMISFGALLGKTSPTQLLIMSVFEVIFFSLNENIGIKMGISDVGGSMVVHTFGAYFGLAATMIVTPKASRGRSDNAAVYHSDLFAMIGTVFLWMFWPSFNGGPATGHLQHRVVVNTVVSLTGSCLAAFVSSQLLRHELKFEMVDVQNATLAGGVAVGAVANMNIKPYGALLIGLIAGTLSVVGYTIIQPWLEKKISLYDTCGVNNLHGMPGVMSGIASAIVAAMATQDSYMADLLNIFTERGNRSAANQGAVQIAFLFITLGIAIAGGLVTGVIMKLQYFDPPHHFFQDMDSWQVPELEVPYYFDKRGEIGHANASKQVSVLVDQEPTSAPVPSQQHTAAPASDGSITLRSVVDRLDVLMSQITLSRFSAKPEHARE